MGNRWSCNATDMGPNMHHLNQSPLYTVIRKFLFILNPETAHALTFCILKHTLRGPLRRWLERRALQCPVTLMGLTFPNPVGLAAGLDQHGEYLEALSALGFGFVEVGGVTPKPQSGNPKPSLFRLPTASALINRKGFPNRGVDFAVSQLRQAQHRCLVGVNLAKNRDTPLTEAVNDYVYGLRAVYPVADYVTVNVSSPNTPGMRQLQNQDELYQLLATLKQEQAQLQHQHQRYVPLVVKIAPDLTTEEIETIAKTLLATGMDGVIATNTTLSREGVAGLAHAEETGGLSGAPLRAQSAQVVRTLYQHLADRIPIIACGGIMSPTDAIEILHAGARLVQIYTGFIYQGPQLVHACVSAIKDQRLAKA